MPLIVTVAVPGFLLFLYSTVMSAYSPSALTTSMFLGSLSRSLSSGLCGCGSLGCRLGSCGSLSCGLCGCGSLSCRLCSCWSLCSRLSSCRSVRCRLCGCRSVGVGYLAGYSLGILTLGCGRSGKKLERKLKRRAVVLNCYEGAVVRAARMPCNAALSVNINNLELIAVRACAVDSVCG